MPIATPQGTLDFKSVDKVTFVGASSNTVIDTTTGSIGVGVDGNGPTSNLHVVGHTRLEGDIDMLHTANTASIKLNSNVVTEFPRSKKLIKFPRVALGTNGSPSSGTGGGYTLSGYTVKASDEYNTTYTASKAFTNTNANTGDTWISQSQAYTSSTGLPVTNSATVAKFGQDGSWIEVGLPNAIQLYYVHITGRHTHFTERTDTADVWASNTGNDGDWVKLTTIDFNDTYTDVIPMVAEIDTQTYYRYFAIQITKLGWSGTYANIGEWKLFGVPEYDPEAHGTDVVVKSVPNVPNTDWLEVYYDAKGLSNGAVTNPISGLGGTTINGTANGGVTVSDGAFVFDGTNDYISTSITTPMTYHTASMWIQFDSPSAWECVYFIGPSSGLDRNNFNLYTNNGYFRLESIGGTNGPYFDLLYDFEIGKWVHLTFVFRGSGLEDCEMYINNERLLPRNVSRSSSDDITITGTNNVYIGHDYGGSYHHDGKIANFRLFNRALSQDEIYQLYAYQKEYFGYGDLSMTLKAGRLGIGTSEPRAALDVRGDIYGGCPVYFAATATSNQNANSTIIWDDVKESRGGGYNSSTGEFTVPIAGVYKFYYSARQSGAGSTAVFARIRKNGTDISTGYGALYLNTTRDMASNMVLLKLNVGDVISVYLFSYSIAANYNVFVGEYFSSL